MEITSPGSWAQHQSAGRGSGTHRSIPPPAPPAACLGMGVPLKPSQGCEAGTAHSAGGSAPRFSGFFCWRIGGLGHRTDPPVAALVGPETGVASLGALGRTPWGRGAAALSVSQSEQRNCPATSLRATYSRGPPPPGPRRAFSHLRAAERAKAQEGGPRAGLQLLPGPIPSPDPALPPGSELGRETPPGSSSCLPHPPRPGLTRPGCAKMPLGSSWEGN